MASTTKKITTRLPASLDLETIKAWLLSLPNLPFEELECFPGDLEIDSDMMELTEEEILRMPSTIKPAPAPTAPASAKSTTGFSTKISIRVPSWVLAAFKARAETSGVAYQRLMNLELQAAVLRAFAPPPISKPKK